jgi:hypothetical protein
MGEQIFTLFMSSDTNKLMCWNKVPFMKLEVDGYVLWKIEKPPNEPFYPAVLQDIKKQIQQFTQLLYSHFFLRWCLGTGVMEFACCLEHWFL